MPEPVKGSCKSGSTVPAAQEYVLVYSFRYFCKSTLLTTNSFTSNTVSIKVGQAAWNYALLKEDLSKGVHNPAYAKALLKNSIEALQ